MSAELHHIITGQKLRPEQVAERTVAIHLELLERSSYLKVPNFHIIHPQDLELLFDAYDAAFFQGAVRRAVGNAPLRFALSKRLTSAGGKTKRTRTRATGALSYELSVSSTILFNSFEEGDHRAIVACGLECRDRLEAVQRIMEHEITHLIELLVWNKSKCSASRFQAITRNFFGHKAHTHSLITPRETAYVKHGIRSGSTVTFVLDGKQHVGVVNRVTRRATVLIEDPQGVRYTNGKHYFKCYVPVELLTVVGGIARGS
ncbi:MAG: hypothetical protein LKM36_09490 [Flavobacteriales bacterium]|jgi:hypothetical protein|nr:hypothetical protein [Flavobacteriales bacterium]